MQHVKTFLALGDSYTIGEAVPVIKSFPYQTVQQVRKKGIEIAAPEIVARSGWTTTELLSAVKEYQFAKTYDVVTLLIGVNNQYRGLSIEEYGTEFLALLQIAIQYAGGSTNKVFVISIPDYSATAFVPDEKKEKVSAEVEAFNKVNNELSVQKGVPYINITTGSRLAAIDAELVASDGLHPSEKEYRKWSNQLFKALLPVLNN